MKLTARILPLLLLAGTARAQVDTLRLPFTALTIDDGLAQGMVSSIAQDRYGFLWFATKDGLDRYDGYSFTTFRHDPADSTTIAENTVNALYVDRTQHLWVVTNGGVDLFDPTTERFRHVPIEHPGGPLREVRMATVDANGDLWVCGKDQFVKVTFAQPVDPGKPLPGCTQEWFDGYAALNLFSDDRLWGTLGSKVLIITPDHHGADVMDTVPPWQGTPPRNYHGLHLVEDTVRGLVHGLGNDFIITIDRRKKGAPSAGMHPLPATTLGANGFTVDGAGRLWATSLQGLYRYDPADRRLVPVEAIGPEHGKTLQHLKSCFLDRGGTLWFGSSGYGLLKYDPRTGRFNKWEDRSVIALNPTRSGKVLVGRLAIPCGYSTTSPMRTAGSTASSPLKTTCGSAPVPTEAKASCSPLAQPRNSTTWPCPPSARASS